MTRVRVWPGFPVRRSDVTPVVNDGGPTNAQILAAINDLATTVKSRDGRIEALEEAVGQLHSSVRIASGREPEPQIMTQVSTVTDELCADDPRHDPAFIAADRRAHLARFGRDAEELSAALAERTDALRAAKARIASCLATGWSQRRVPAGPSTPNCGISCGSGSTTMG
jgi:hypothetical protein